MRLVDSMRNRWLIALVGAVVIALAITTVLSRGAETADKSSDDAMRLWKARTGVDLRDLPTVHPPNPDTDEARQLDALLEPIGLRLGARRKDRRPPAPSAPDEESLDALRDSLRAAIRAETTETRPLPAAAIAGIERTAKTLDAVADYVAAHNDIRWREDFGPRERTSSLYSSDHLTLHRLLIGRAFVAVEKGDKSTALRMVATSENLKGVLEARQELWSHFVATGVERLHLALMRRAHNLLELAAPAPRRDSLQRFVNGMSAEALVLLTNARNNVIDVDDDVPDRIVHVIAGPKMERATSAAMRSAAQTVDEIRRSQDGCAELATKVRRRPRGFFAGDLYTLDASEAWRRFIFLELDRAITAALLTGKVSSPCASVVISVRDEGSTRTVTATNLPEESHNVIGLPSVVATRLDNAATAKSSSRPVRTPASATSR